MKKICCVASIVFLLPGGGMQAMDFELNSNETSITVVETKKEESFSDFQSGLQLAPVVAVQPGNDALDMMKNYGVEVLPDDLVDRLNKKLQKVDGDSLCSVTKGKRKKKDPTQILIKNLGNYVNTQDMNLKMQNEKLKEEKQDREKAEKQKWCLMISNVVSWGANCGVSTLTLGGTVAAVVLTVVQAIKG